MSSSSNSTRNSHNSPVPKVAGIEGVVEKESNRTLSDDGEEMMMKDKYNLIYICYFLYGFGCLMSFNAVLSTLAFFN
jgi:hypothetical protein